jgi:hypothetical protein
MPPPSEEAVSYPTASRRARYDKALHKLAAQFPNVPERIVATVLNGYLAREKSLRRAQRAARDRISDARAVG